MSKETLQILNGKSFGLGTCIFVVFWQVFDSLALGIALGITMGVAFSASNKTSCDSQSHD